MTARTRIGLLVVVGALGVAVMGAGYWFAFHRQFGRAGQGSVSIGAGTVAAPPAPSAPSSANPAADALESDLAGDLNSGFYAPGDTYGGFFTEGTVVQQAEEHGGVLLSLTPATAADPWNSAQVMFGLDPGTGAASPACYDYRFTISGAPRRQGTPCPDAAVRSRARQLYARRAEPDQEPSSPDAFPVTTAGARALLARAFPAAERAAVARLPLSTATRSGVLGAAVRVDGVCDYLWLGRSSTSSLIQVWPASLAEQADCDGAHALAAGDLYGRDAAQEG
ncbi:hypothetical protein [Streptacidiphilus sp. P02-A3a]|uniref:hypothetical protein n=1 Tax=Streptacidiphilus sp. P02-A3a TaxID=2704468 RepID=UPI0015FCE85D|nr:hypothetical protein [Streptacidiphilus sp. P02-A3a]QMU69555.1 hypothetical protein GXP74_16235 [Streptacidiphilus sp. P02-A3a]